MNEERVVVCSAESPSSFYVLQENFVKSENQFQEELLMELSKANALPSPISLKDLYFARTSGQWYRVRVKKILSENSCLEVFFVDYGQTEIIKGSALRKCNSNMEGKAIKCSLLTKLQLTEHGAWTNDMKTLFKFLVSKRKLFKMITTCVSKDTHYVDLITIGRHQNYSIADYLMSVNNVQITPSIAIKVKPIKDLEITGLTAIKMRYIISPSEFYVAERDLEQDEAVMQIELTEFYEQNPANFTLLAPGVKCATEGKLGQWNRVEILKWPDSEGWCQVKFIDNGNIEHVPWHGLYELDAQFYDFPCFALKCSLGGIEPVGGSWTVESTNFMSSNLKNCNHLVEMIKIADGVRIFVDFKGMKIDINESLVYFKHATSNDETTFKTLYEKSEDAFAGLSISEHLHHVEIIDKKNFNPFGFHIKFLEYSGATESIFERIQNDEKEDGTSWRAGDKCVVFCIVNDNEAHWERGLITRQTSKTHVYLTDHRLEVQVSLSMVKKCPDDFKDLGPLSTKVRLACNTNGSWTSKEEQSLRSIVNTYEKLFVTFKDDNRIQFSLNSDPRPVILWGKQANGTKQNIVSELEQNGLVVSLFSEKNVVPPEKKDWTLIDYVEEGMKDEQRKLSQCFVLDGSSIRIGDYNVKLEKKLKAQWLPALPITNSSFVAKVTHVDRDGFVLMYNIWQESLLTQVNDMVNLYFKGIARNNYQFAVDDACLVLFENDELYYRGKIIEMHDNECSVLFIDYGNIQRCQMKRLFQHVICHEVPAIAQRFRLEHPPLEPDGSLDQEVLDKLHVLIVDKEASICIHRDDVDNIDPNYVKRCVIRSGEHVFRSYREVEKIWSTLTDNI